jgi:hypothetical protein
MAGSDLNFTFFLCATIEIENLDLAPFWQFSSGILILPDKKY